MAPHGEAILSNTTTTTINNNTTNNNNNNYTPRSMMMMMSTNNNKPQPRFSKDNNNSNLQRTVSDISFELMSKEAAMVLDHHDHHHHQLPPISEVEDAKCECCGMSEECTPDYINRVRSKFLGKWICGLCSEAVKEEMTKINNNSNEKVGLEEALRVHMSACARFNKFGRAYPVLSQAEAMREMLKKSTRRAKSFNPKSGAQKVGGIARSSSCIPAITREYLHGDDHRLN